MEKRGSAMQSGGSGSSGNLKSVPDISCQLEDTCRILVVVRFPCGAEVVPALFLFLRARHASPTSSSLLHSIVALLGHRSALARSALEQCLVPDASLLPAPSELTSLPPRVYESQARAIVSTVKAGGLW